MLGAIVGGKLFRALRVETPPHLIHCFTDGRTRRTKDPSAFRATRSLSILIFGPYQFAGRTSLSLIEHAALTSGLGDGMLKSSMRGKSQPCRVLRRLPLPVKAARCCRMTLRRKLSRPSREISLFCIIRPAFEKDSQWLPVSVAGLAPTVESATVTE